MHRFPSGWLVGSAVCVVLSFSPVNAAAPDVRDTPLGKEISRATDVESECGGLKVFKTAEYDACITSAQQKNRQKVGDATGFEVGLYMMAWFAMDSLARPDYPPSTDKLKKAQVDATPLAAKYFKLYRAAQKKAGISDAQVLHVTLLDHDLLTPKIAAADRGY